jgi:hypothetical protein
VGQLVQWAFERGRAAKAITRELDLGTRLIRGEAVDARFGSSKASRTVGEELLVRVGERAAGGGEQLRALLEVGQYYERDGRPTLAAEVYRVYANIAPSGESGAAAEGRATQLEKARTR